MTSVAEPTEHFPNQKAQMRLEAYLSQSLQEMAGTGMLSDKANRVRARSLVVAEFRRMEEQYLTDQLPLGVEPRVRIAESSHASRLLARTAKAEKRPSSGGSSPSRETEARSGMAFAERLDKHAAAERRRKREAAAARSNALMPLERKGSAGRSRAGSAGRREGQSLHFDVDEDSGKSVADQLRDALSHETPCIDFDQQDEPASQGCRCVAPLTVLVDEVNVASRMTSSTTRHQLTRRSGPPPARCACASVRSTSYVVTAHSEASTE